MNVNLKLKKTSIWFLALFPTSCSNLEGPFGFLPWFTHVYNKDNNPHLLALCENETQRMKNASYYVISRQSVNALCMQCKVEDSSVHYHNRTKQSI